MRFYAFWPLSQTRLFHICRGLGLVARRWCKGMHERVSWEKGGDGICWGGTRVVGCAWRLSLSSFKVLPPSFLALPVNELLCDFMLSAARCSYNVFKWNFAAFLAVMRFPYEIICFLLHNFLIRVPYKSSCFLLCSFLMIFAYEISCCLALMRFYAISLWVFMLFDPNAISLRDFMLICYFLMRFHVFCRCKISLWDFTLYSCIIILCDFMFLGCYEISLWDLLLFVA